MTVRENCIAILPPQGAQSPRLPAKRESTQSHNPLFDVAAARRPYGSARTQMFLKLIGSLLSPCACSLIGASSYAL